MVLPALSSPVFLAVCFPPLLYAGILVVLLAVVAGQGSLSRGILLLLCYSIGHGVLAVLAGTLVGFLQRLAQSRRYGQVSAILRLVMGALILLLGFYMFYLGF